MLLKKIIRNVIIGIIGVFLFYIVLGIIFAHNFSYEKTICQPKSAPKIMSLFNDSVSSQITISSLYTNNLNDSICVFNYKKYGLFLWMIGQYKNDFLSLKVDTIQKKYTEKQIVFYSNRPINIGSLGLIYSKAFLSNDQQIAIRFYNCKNINCLHNSIDYQYYHLKGSSIYFVSQPNTYYDTDIEMADNTDMDFLVKRFDDKIYVIGMYSLDNKDVTDNDLLNILRKNFL